MTKPSTGLSWIVLHLSLSVLAFLVLYLTISKVDTFQPFLTDAAKKSEVIGSTVCGFAFTMMGFLAAMITIFFSSTEHPFFKRYRSHGHFMDFMHMYYVAIVCLFFTFGAGLAGIVKASLTHPMLAAVGVNLLQFLVICCFLWRFSVKVSAPE